MCSEFQGPPNGGVSRSGLVLPFFPFLSFLGLSRLFRDFPRFARRWSGDFPDSSLFLFLGLLSTPTRNSQWFSFSQELLSQPLCAHAISLSFMASFLSKKGPRHSKNGGHRKTLWHTIVIHSLLGGSQIFSTVGSLGTVQGRETT